MFHINAWKNYTLGVRVEVSEESSAIATEFGVASTVLELSDFHNAAQVQVELPSA